MSNLKLNCFDIFYPEINNSSFIGYNNFDKSSDSSITIMKNDSESNQEVSSDVFLPINEEKIFSNNKSSCNAYNFGINSLKKTNVNTKKTNAKIKKYISHITKTKKKGRPKIKNTKKKTHTKNSKDNRKCKIKNLLLKSIRKYINTKIDIKYKIGKKYDGQLLITKKKENQNESICFYRTFFQKTIRDIFSEDISNRYQNCSKTHNKELIEKLLNDNNEENRKYYNELFELKLINCLQHFRKYALYSCLKGLKTFKEMKHELKKKGEEDDYIKNLKKSLDELEDELILKK